MGPRLDRPLFFLVALVAGCAGPPERRRDTGVHHQPAEPPGNVLIVVLDDLGIDHVRSYYPELVHPRQPTLDRLAAEGVRFSTVYGAPICSPARAMLLTGRYPHETGLGFNMDDGTIPELGLAQITLPEVLEGGTTPYATAAFGKWHLVGRDGPSGLDHPNLAGFDHFAGTISNLNDQSYYAHGTLIDGQEGWSTEYATTETVDDALGWLGVTPEPFLAWVALHAPHTPLEAPPSGLLAEPLSADAGDLLVYGAMIEAMDTELGRLLDGLGDARRARTTVLVVGDNGTTDDAVLPPFQASRSKGSVYEGGVRVPLLVSGSGVSAAGGVSDALVSVIDVFPTVAELAGIDPGALPDEPRHGRSLVPLLEQPGAPFRDVVYTEQFRGSVGPPWASWDWTLRDHRWKLMGHEDADVAAQVLYDLSLGSYDEGDAIFAPQDAEQQAAWDRLGEARVALLAATGAAP